MPPPAARARPPPQQPTAYSSSSSSCSIGQAARNGVHVQSLPSSSLTGAYRPASAQAADMFSLLPQAPQQQQQHNGLPSTAAAAADTSNMLDDAMLIAEDHEQEALAASLFDFDSDLGDTGV
jgi:hypothetical protein